MPVESSLCYPKAKKQMHVPFLETNYLTWEVCILNECGVLIEMFAVGSVLLPSWYQGWREKKIHLTALCFVCFKQLSFYLPKASCHWHCGPKTCRRNGGQGEPSCLPGAACPILFPTRDGRVDKVCPWAVKYLLNFVCVLVTQLCPTLRPHGL